MTIYLFTIQGIFWECEALFFNCSGNIKNSSRVEPILSVPNCAVHSGRFFLPVFRKQSTVNM